MRDVWNWLWCLGARERPSRDALDKLHTSMRTTAKSRYNAAVRLQRQSKFAFFTTTAFSLGLILMPLLQSTEIPLAYPPAVYSAMQVFLAVAVLVYSVIIGTARYDIRAENLTECGDKLKQLIRELDRYRDPGAAITDDALANYYTRYSDIVTDSENHLRSDYHLAALEMRNDYFVTGFPWVKTLVTAHFSRSTAYVIPTLMMLVELFFVADSLGVTCVLTTHLAGVCRD